MIIHEYSWFCFAFPPIWHDKSFPCHSGNQGWAKGSKPPCHSKHNQAYWFANRTGVLEWIIIIPNVSSLSPTIINQWSLNINEYNIYIILHPHMMLKCPLNHSATRALNVARLRTSVMPWWKLAARARQGTAASTVQLGLVKADFHHYPGLNWHRCGKPIYWFFPQEFNHYENGHLKYLNGKIMDI